MERDNAPPPERPSRRPWHTPLRVVAVVILAWLFAGGTSPLSINPIHFLAVAAGLSLLAVYELNIRDIGDEWVLATVLGILAVAGAAFGVWHFTRPLPTTGALTPANDPTPATTCKQTAGKGDLVMAFGTDRVVGQGDGPFVPVVVDDCQSLSLRRAKGGLMVRAFFYDWTNDIAMNVMDNQFEANMSISARFFRPDAHSLVILDRFDTEILYVRYLNPGAVRILGRFLCADRPQAIISDAGIRTGGMRVQGAYMGTRPEPGHKCARIKANGEGIHVNP
jgi:hypothetical protein